MCGWSWDGERAPAGGDGEGGTAAPADLGLPAVGATGGVGVRAVAEEHNGSILCTVVQIFGLLSESFGSQNSIQYTSLHGNFPSGGLMYLEGAKCTDF